MTRFLNLPITWRDLGRSVLRVVLLTITAGLMTVGKLVYISGARLQDLGERFR